MVHSVLADDDSYGVFGTLKRTDSYVQTNNRRVKKELQIFAILAAGSKGGRSVRPPYEGQGLALPPGKCVS